MQRRSTRSMEGSSSSHVNSCTRSAFSSAWARCLCCIINKVLAKCAWVILCGCTLQTPSKAVNLQLLCCILFALVFTSTKEVMFSSVFVCLFVNRIMQKLLSPYSQRSHDRWHMGHGGSRYISVVNQIMLHYTVVKVKVGLGSWLGEALPYSTWEDFVPRHLFNSNKIVTSVALRRYALYWVPF